MDEKTVVTSTGALALPAIPKTMVVIGAGVIGLELGSVYARLGTEVTVVEYLDQITPGMDAEICKTLQKILTKQGLKFVLGAAVQGVEPSRERRRRSSTSSARTRASRGSTPTSSSSPRAASPTPTASASTRSASQMSKRGQIETDAHWRTSVPGIYAIGDAIAGPMLAHKAEDEGMAVAEIIAGQHGHVNYGVIPGVIYTTPEVATRRRDRGAAEGEGPRLQGRQVPLHGQRPRQGRCSRARAS